MELGGDTTGLRCGTAQPQSLQATSGHVPDSGQRHPASLAGAGAGAGAQALAASIAAMSASSSATCGARASWRHCSSEVALAIGATMPG